MPHTAPSGYALLIDALDQDGLVLRSMTTNQKSLWLADSLVSSTATQRSEVRDGFRVLGLSERALVNRWFDYQSAFSGGGR